MKVLLCLLSDQHVPNLLSVHHFKPDRLILVESSGMKEKNTAAHFLKALKLGGLDYDGRHDIEPLHMEDSLEAVRAALRQAFGKYPAADWIANLTGGTKPMSLAAYEFFKALEGRLIYTNFARPAVLLDMTTQQAETFQHSLSIKEFLAGYGFESRKADVNIQEAEVRAKEWGPCARVLSEHASSADLLPLSDQERRKARDKGMMLQLGQLQTTDAAVRASVADTFKLASDGGGAPSGPLSKYAVEFLTGGWLEVFFWNILSRHANVLGLSDVRLGLEVGRFGDSSGNDFDVAFMHNYRLAMIECKSGSQEHDRGADVLYKVEAVIRQFRALGVRSYLSTTADHVLDKEGRIKAALRNRAEIYGCRILTTAELRQLAGKSDDADFVRQTIFGQPS
jgi:hypothetical protein